MKAMALALPAVLLASLIAAHADDKKDDNKTKLVGVWELIKSQSGGPPGATAEFTKDGKIKITIEDKDKKLKQTIDGTYEVEDESLKTALKAPDGKIRKETMKIKKLTEKELITVDEKNKEDEFTRQEKK